MTTPCHESVPPCALAVQRVSKTFCSARGTGVQALESIDLAVGSGEFVVLIGPTGCGKTTLLNIIAGLDHSDRGQVCFEAGMNRENALAYVFQHYTLFPWRRLLANVAFGLQMQGKKRPARNAAARALLGNVGLGHFEHAYPHELSGGMRQRAAIAQALAVEPRILLMDEPFGALDDATRKDLQQLLIDLWQTTKMSVLFVTHNIDEAVVMADRIVVLSDRPGRIVKEITVDLPRPRDQLTKPFTSRLLEVRQAMYSGARSVRDT
ncbi:MAG: ABC transporter ATP-binding protein [Pirellulales bacterium]|nr:ABC transporter ATP-binding protein [Pirellulales bacterium]